MKLEIISPERRIFTGEVESVRLPGAIGSFTVLSCHAPLISLLNAGEIIYTANGDETRLKIESGFVEVKNNVVFVCTEKMIKS